MSKIQRNQPCHCNSGKKYKKCCGVSSRAVSAPQVVNQELQNAHLELNGILMQSFGKVLQEETEKYSQNFNGDEFEEVFRLGMLPWFALHKRLGKNNITIYEAFKNTIKTKVSVEAREIIEEWSHKGPSVYEVISVDPDQFVTVKDIMTEESFRIPFIKDEFIEGGLAVGTLVPLADAQHTFLLTVVKVYDYGKKTLLNYLQKYDSLDGGLKKNYPEFLLAVIELNVNSTDSIYDKVIQAFANHMLQKNIEEKTILKGIQYWNEFCEQENPTVKKVETLAAALEYLVQKHILKNDAISQEQLAKEYKISSSSISSNYRKLNLVIAG